MGFMKGRACELGLDKEVGHRQRRRIGVSRNREQHKELHGDRQKKKKKKSMSLDYLV